MIVPILSGIGYGYLNIIVAQLLTPVPVKVKLSVRFVVVVYQI